MNVLLAIKGLGRGGAERIVADCAQLGDRSRFRYEVAFSLSGKDALVKEIRAAGISVEHLDDQALAAASRIRSIVRRRSIDVVHIHSPVMASFARLIGIGAPIVYTEHNEWSRYAGHTRLANAATYARNAHVFAVSEEVRRSIAGWAVRSLNGAVETLHHGVHPEFEPRWSGKPDIRGELGLGPDVPLLVSVGNFKSFKGQEHLLYAASIVARSVPEARFVLVGVGPRETYMRELARRLQLEDKVIFAGLREDAPRLTASADIFVLPSEREGLPIALLEAMALGRPSVVTGVGGVPEIVRNGEAIVVPPRDVDALAGGILRLLNDEGLRDRMGESARLRAKDFDIRKAVRRMEQVYEELLT